MLRPVHLARARGATPRPRSGTEARRTSCPRGGGQEELPHIRGQGQKPGDPYPKGGSQEELPHVRGQGQRPRVPGCDGAAMAKRSYPTTEARGSGREDPPHARGQGRQPRGPTSRPRPGAAAGRSNPTSKERWLRGGRRD